MAQTDKRIQRRPEHHNSAAAYPPYHSKYNPIERVFRVLEKYCNGDPLRTVEKALGFAAGMTCKGVYQVAKLVTKAYATGIKLCNKIRRHYEQALDRAPELRKWLVTIDPGQAMRVCALAKE